MFLFETKNAKYFLHKTGFESRLLFIRIILKIKKLRLRKRKKQARKETRTLNPLITSQVLYQLSYTSKKEVKIPIKC